MELLNFNAKRLTDNKITRFIDTEKKIQLIQAGMAICLRRSKAGLWVLDAVSKDVFLNMVYFCHYLGFTVDNDVFTKSELDFVYKRRLHREIEHIAKDKGNILCLIVRDVKEDYERFVKMFNIEINNEIQCRNYVVKKNDTAAANAKLARQIAGTSMPDTTSEDFENTDKEDFDSASHTEETINDIESGEQTTNEKA